MDEHVSDVATMPGERRGRRERIEPASPSWVAIVCSTADKLQGELDRSVQHRIDSAPGGRSRPHPSEAIVAAALQRARDQAERPQLRVTGIWRVPRRACRRLGSWWSGADVDQAWAALHVAGQGLLEVEPPDAVKAQIADLAVVTTLSPGDLRIRVYLNTLKALAVPARSIMVADRAQLRAIRQACDSSSDGAHADARAYRNTLILLGSLLALALGIVASISFFDEDFRALFAATMPQHPPGRSYVLELELIASLAGVTGALLSLNNYSGFQSTYGLPLVQAFLKGGTGAATGLLGVLLFQSELVSSLTPQAKTPGVFAVAIVFGYAQYLFTRLVDNQAKTVLTSASSRNDPNTTPQLPAAGGSSDLLTTEQTATSAESPPKPQKTLPAKGRPTPKR